MTRATLLHVLERPTDLGPDDVRELERLAQAFPYCQTAHLLLAKAAHDQGTMLASQRLRRAATYAADRTLLRRLIELEQAAPPIAPALAVLPAAPYPLALVDLPDEYVPAVAVPLAAPLPVAPVLPAPVEELPPVALPVVSGLVIGKAAVSSPDSTVPAVTPAPLVEMAALPEPTPAPTPAPIAANSHTPGPSPELAQPAPLAPAAVAQLIELAELPVATPIIVTSEVITTAETPEVAAPLASATPEIASPPVEADAPAVAVAEPESSAATKATAPAAAAITAPEPLVEQLLAAPTTLETTDVAPAAEAIPAPAAEAFPEPVPEIPVAGLPAQAPAIRPPVEVGEARFEFGLADPAPTMAVTTYELPGLVDEWAASAVTRSLGNLEALVSVQPAPATPVFTPAAFTGDATVGYAFGESSRLGLAMQLLDLLTAKAETAEAATAVVAAAQPAATPLPPTGTFFEPDPLLLDHWATHRPTVPELPSTIDLINNFLKRQPRLTRAAMLPPAAAHQPDLSVRSTRAEPDLVSENLARIFVRQGKTARAIEIYEKLMVKQPEKMAYFALQIQSLQPSA